MKVPADRRAVLAEGSLAIGAAWADLWCEQMTRDGRAVAGGWPGTLPEAQARVAAYFQADLARRNMLQLSVQELASTTQDAYEMAKLRWLNVQKERRPKVEGKSKRKPGVLQG